MTHGRILKYLIAFKESWECYCRGNLYNVHTRNPSVGSVLSRAIVQSLPQYERTSRDTTHPQKCMEKTRFILYWELTLENCRLRKWYFSAISSSDALSVSYSPPWWIFSSIIISFLSSLWSACPEEVADNRMRLWWKCLTPPVFANDACVAVVLG